MFLNDLDIMAAVEKDDATWNGASWNKENGKNFKMQHMLSGMILWVSYRWSHIRAHGEMVNPGGKSILPLWESVEQCH